MSDQDEIYKQKYLKYKAKYLELKRYEQEGGLFDSGFGIVFTTLENATKLREAITAGRIGGKGDIANLLDRQAYIIFDGKKPAELLESTSRILKDKAKAAASATMAATTAAASATMAAASKAASATAAAASKVATITSTAIKDFQDSRAKAAADKAAFAEFKAQQNVAPGTAVTTGTAVTPVTQTTSNLATLIGGAEGQENLTTALPENLPKTLPLKIATLDGKSYDRANEAHKKHLIAAVAAAFDLPVDQITSVSIKFKALGKPELRE